MFLDLVRDRSRTFPDLSDPEAVTSARVWHCRYDTLAPLGRLANCRSLKIATYPDSSFDILTALEKLEVLEVLHLPNVRDMSALAALKALRVLELATLPSWDSSGKVTEVQSLKPLVDLQHLVEVRLFGVRPPSRSVDDLIAIRSLRSARISKYPKKEIERLDRALDERDLAADA